MLEALDPERVNPKLYSLNPNIGVGISRSVKFLVARVPT